MRKPWEHIVFSKKKNKVMKPKEQSLGYNISCPVCKKNLSLDDVTSPTWKYAFKKRRKWFKCPQCHEEIDRTYKLWSNTCTECKHTIPYGYEHWVGRKGVFGVAYLCPRCLDELIIRKKWYGELTRKLDRQLNKKEENESVVFEPIFSKSWC